MRTLVVALALACTSTDPDGLTMTLDMSDSTLGEVLDQLREISGVPIEMDEAARKKLDLSAKTTLKAKDLNLTSTVRLLFSGKGVEVKAVDKKKIVISAAK